VPVQGCTLPYLTFYILIKSKDDKRDVAKKEEKFIRSLVKKNLKEIVHQEDLGVNRSFILKRISNRKAGGGYDSCAS